MAPSGEPPIRSTWVVEPRIPGNENRARVVSRACFERLAKRARACQATSVRAMSPNIVLFYSNCKFLDAH
jgi:hypothetical protein